jgi:short-subunit dehydrogenase
MEPFQDKTMVITGASEGIGRALCLALAPQRPRLVLAARNEARLIELKGQVEALGAQALVVTVDLTEAQACKTLIERTVEHFGSLDVLVNNAGGTMWTPFEEVTDLGIFEHLMRLNYLSAVYCTHHALPHLKRSRGRLVGVASVAGLTGVPARTGYAASKHAMFGFFDSLRIELAGSGVSVTMIAPDFVVSEIHRRALGGDGRPLGQSPMQEAKIMTAETCASMMVTAIARRDRLLITSARGKSVRWLKFLAPALVDTIAAKAIRERK